MREEIEDPPEGPVEIGIIGDMTEHGADLTDKLLAVPQGGECVIYFDSPGGSPYCGLSLMSLIVVRQLHATGLVTGECSSAALWPLAACARRIVTPYSVLLFHPMRWQSEESVQLSEAAEWARHFAHLEGQMDRLLADMFGVAHDEIAGWVRPGTYVSGPEFAAAGLAELVDVVKLAQELRKGLDQDSGKRK